MIVDCIVNGPEEAVAFDVGDCIAAWLMFTFLAIVFVIALLATVIR